MAYNKSLREAYLEEIAIIKAAADDASNMVPVSIKTTDRDR